MSNSKLITETYKAHSNNYSIGRSGRKIEKVTIHHMAGVLTAKQCGSIFQDGNRQASSNYGIGKNGEIALFVDEANTSYADANWDSNCKSVTIECSNNKTGGDWTVSDTVLNSLINLIADIFKRNGIKKAIKGETITWHSMYSATTCPGNYLRSKVDYITEEVNKILNNNEKVIGTVKVTADIGLNCRENATTNSSIIKAYTKGTSLKIYEIKGKWGRTDDGWVCLDYTDYKKNTGSSSSNSQKYTTGHYIVTTDVLTVRKGPGTDYDWLRYSQLTSNAQKQIYEKCSYKPNGLCKNVECDVSEIKNNWGKIPSRLDLFRLLQKNIKFKARYIENMYRAICIGGI